MNKIKRFLAGFLCLAMLLSLTGCGKESSGDEQQTKDYVYTTEFKTLEGVDYLGDAVIQGNTMYFSEWNYDEATGMGSYVFYTMDLGTMEKTKLPLSVADNETIRGIAARQDGSKIILIGAWDENGTESYSLVGLDAAGNETARQDITAALTAGTDPEFGIYVQNMEVDPDGNVYLLVNGQSEKVVVLNTQGQKQFEVGSDSWFQGMCMSGDGRVFAMSYDYSNGSSGYILQHVDPKTKGFGDTFKGIPSGNGSFSCVSGGENELLISSGNSLYSYDLNTQTCEEILNWIDCDINADNVQLFTRTGEGKILAFTYSWGNDGTNNCEAVSLTKTPASEVKQKTILTYATMYLDYQLKAQIIDFNKTNDTYRIEVKEYGAGDYTAGMAQLNSDIVSGNTPDIIDLNSGNVTTYISKGILTDLYALMDSELGKEDFVPSALKIYEEDGKLYGVCVSFSVDTLMGRTSDVGTEMGWTVEDVKALMESKPAGTELLEYASRDTILYTLVSMGADAYIDWETGTCSFNTDDFIGLLEFSNTFPSADSISYEDQESTYSKLSQGKLLLQGLYVSGVDEYLMHEAMFGVPTTCIGYPTPDGKGGTILNPNMSLGIAEKSKNKEGAWTFIKSVLSEDFQDTLDWSFPARESSLQKVFDEAMDEKEYGSGWGYDDFTYETRPATEEEIARIRQVIDNAQGRVSYNQDIMSIIQEEAAPFFAGQKTAREVADIIQSRVQIYVSENS